MFSCQCVALDQELIGIESSVKYRMSYKLIPNSLVVLFPHTVTAFIDLKELHNVF